MERVIPLKTIIVDQRTGVIVPEDPRDFSGYDIWFQGSPSDRNDNPLPLNPPTFGKRIRPTRQ